MKLIVAYLIFIALALGALLLAMSLVEMPENLESLRLPIGCAAVGGVGGCVYCLRGVYLNACVRKQWDDDWQPWYYIRPLVSVMCGCVSFLFLKAGLLVLEASKTPESTNLGFYALAFISGLNVDKFIAKIEGIAQAAWGIERSRTASKDGNHGDGSSP